MRQVRGKRRSREQEQKGSVPAGHRALDIRRAAPGVGSHAAGAQKMKGSRESPSSFDAWCPTWQTGSAPAQGGPGLPAGWVGKERVRGSCRAPDADLASRPSADPILAHLPLPPALSLWAAAPLHPGGRKRSLLAYEKHCREGKKAPNLAEAGEEERECV